MSDHTGLAANSWWIGSMFVAADRDDRATFRYDIKQLSDPFPHRLWIRSAEFSFQFDPAPLLLLGHSSFATQWAVGVMEK